MTERKGTPEQREQEKRGKLEYAYTAPDSIKLYPMLGSLMRAIGKGWQVLVLCPEEHAPIFQQVREQLQHPEQVTISLKPMKQKFDLVLSTYGDKQTDKSIRDNNQVLGKSHVMTVEPEPSILEYDLISGFSEEVINPQGVISVTGNGKGKTTTALGIGLESMVEGGRVVVIQWFKERKKPGEISWAINEHEFPNSLVQPEQIEFHPTGLGFYGSPTMDRVEGEKAYQQHRAKAYEGLELATQLINSGMYSTIILDELIDTVSEIAGNIPYPLIDLHDLQQFFASLSSQTRPQIVVTGRRVTEHWQHYIGRSIVISEIKHPWSSSRKGAVSGLDF